jgi:GntR family transcriptional regulator
LKSDEHLHAAVSRLSPSDSNNAFVGSATNRFLYRGVAEVLRQRIQSGEYTPGMQIPTVAELASQFDVSTITIRRAVRDLSFEGKLVGRQGLGVFVAKDRRIVRSLSVDDIGPIEQDMAQSGVRPSLLNLGSTTVSPKQEPFLAKLGKGQRSLLQLDRVLLADGEPVALDVIWLSHRTANVLKDKLNGEFLMSLLERRGISVESVTYQVEATTASEAQASRLGLVVGFPLLVVRFFPIDEAARPILVGQTITRADRFTYEVGTKIRRSNRR